MKKKIRLIWRLYSSYLVMIFVLLFSVAFTTSNFIEDFFLKSIEKDLTTRGLLLRDQVLPLVLPQAYQRLDALCKRQGKAAGTRITVILPDGLVVADTEKDPAMMNNHHNRPEILAAFNGNYGTSIRDSETLRQRMMYVALPLLYQGKIPAVVRVSIPITAIRQTIGVVQSRLMQVGIVIAVLASIVSLLMSRQISRPIQEMRAGAMKFAAGELSHRLHEPSISELASLAEVMNQTAFELDDRIATVRKQRNEYEAVLSSMTEGVVGVDLEQKVITINKAARVMLGTDSEAVDRRDMQEISRNSDLNRLIGQTLESGEYKEKDIVFFRKGEERILHSKSAALTGPDGNNIGVLIVLTEVTQLRRLENMRRDFAANVSHEIKTPLTAIKGFVETLRYDREHDPDNIDRFLAIIDRHVDRLTVIINDLLQLSRIEQKDETTQLNRQVHPVVDLLASCRQHNRDVAADRGVTVDLQCDPDLKAFMDRSLMEQAVVNLLDNAVKYSDTGSKVLLTAESEEDRVRIQVQDHGIGIDPKHHDRLFERFYRVDKARSRKLGGTGLGLAIVKHIAIAHGGNVQVQSAPGAGSCFTIWFPQEG